MKAARGVVAIRQYISAISRASAPSLKNPKGKRDVAEWYMSTRTRRGYIHRVFERQCELGT